MELIQGGIIVLHPVKKRHWINKKLEYCELYCFAFMSVKLE